MADIEESLVGIVNRVTYHNPDNGWSVLRVQPFDSPGKQETVTVHQTQVFAGATMAFQGAWRVDPKYGRQFQASRALEKKPATAASLEKYLGSGLIKGLGPKTARRIVRHFAGDTLDVFEHDMGRLTEVPGIAHKKLLMIEQAWREHRAIRDVMMFLQGHGISTLFAVRIYQQYGDDAIAVVSADAYRLASDIYGIGFFSADRIALSLGMAPDSPQRVVAAIRHVLTASREQGHCYLTAEQIGQGVRELIELDLAERLDAVLEAMRLDDQLRLRTRVHDGEPLRCYYAKSLYYDEQSVANSLRALRAQVPVDAARVRAWIARYCARHTISLSDEQADAVASVVQYRFSVLTGGPGCGKTTTTLVIVRLLEAMGRRIALAAPTGRATQRMSEVIGREAKTLHRLLEWKAGQFQVNAENPLRVDFLIVDECSMLDISLSASLLQAVPAECQVLLIGDADQLPSVGAGNVLRDIIHSGALPCFRLTQVFRQARHSLIVRYAHQINHGKLPRIDSPFRCPEAWQEQRDCLFIDSHEATQAELGFIGQVKRFFDGRSDQFDQHATGDAAGYAFRTDEPIASPYEVEFSVPERFAHSDLRAIHTSRREVDALKALLGKLHPWSSLRFGLTALDCVVKLYLEWIPKYHGRDMEIQILSPMTRGTLGTANLNQVIQQAANPPAEGKRQLKVGERIFREGDRVIHRRNNYDLNVFNGDIGTIGAIDHDDLSCEVTFLPDGRTVHYQKDDIVELDLAYAITIHKAQGSEFDAVIIPVLSQHFRMLYRNLIYTGLTRAKRQAVFVGTRRALSMAVRQQDSSIRQTALSELLSADRTS